MNHKIIEIDKTSELFPQSLLAIGDDSPGKLYLMGNVELLKAEKSVAIIGARAATTTCCLKALRRGFEAVPLDADASCGMVQRIGNERGKGGRREKSATRKKTPSVPQCCIFAPKKKIN